MMQDVAGTQEVWTTLTTQLSFTVISNNESAVSARVVHEFEVTTLSLETDRRAVT